METVFSTAGYPFIRCAGYEITFEEFLGVEAVQNASVDQKIDSVNENYDDILEVSKANYDLSKKRLSDVIDKGKTLLTITSVLLTLFGLLYKSGDIKGFFCIVPLILLITVFLLLHLLRVKGLSTVVFSKSEYESPRNAFKINLVNSYLDCASSVSFKCDRAVDLYRAAQLYLFIGLVMTTGMITYTSWNSPVIENANKSISDTLYCIGLDGRSGVSPSIKYPSGYFHLFPTKNISYTDSMFIFPFRN